MRFRLVISAALAATSLASATIADAMPINDALKDVAPAQIENVRWHGGGGRGGWGRGGWGWGAGGFAAGALLGSALARPYYGGYGYYPYYPAYPAPAPAYYPPPGYAGPGGDAVNYCMQRFRSYDPRSGTYLGFDGARHPCP
ncbi:MAG: BA14K family protein [Xanthobacteraceae bacterium]